MARESEKAGTSSVAPDLGEYCRRVEAHLARVNEGQLIRIAGVAFDLVRGWIADGVPLSIVFHGIDQKAARHRVGRSRRPLRLEFCGDDVRAAFDEWRRAVGAWHDDADSAAVPPAQAERRRPSPVRQIDRAMDRVVAAAGRSDVPGEVAEALTAILERMVTLRDELKGTRGAGRREVLQRAAELDRELSDVARRAAGPAAGSIEAEASRELHAFRERMPHPAWERSVRAAADRLFRDRLGLPHLDLTPGEEPGEDGPG